MAGDSAQTVSSGLTDEASDARTADSGGRSTTRTPCRCGLTRTRGSGTPGSLIFSKL